VLANTKLATTATRHGLKRLWRGITAHIEHAGAAPLQLLNWQMKLRFNIIRV